MNWFKTCHGSEPPNEQQQGQSKDKAASATGSSIAIVGDSSAADRGSEEVLLTIPGAIAHLVDGEESVHLATGAFSLLRLAQADGEGIAVLAKLGSDLQWPLTKDQPTTKLDPTHYFFTLKVLPELDQEDEPPENAAAKQEVSETLIYGITFSASEASLLLELDKHLELYSSFSVPQVVQGKPAEGGASQKKGKLVRLEEYFFGKPSKPVSSPPEKTEGKATLPVQEASTATAAVGSSVDNGKGKPAEDRSSAYWTALAPNVEDYSSSMAKGIAGQSNYVIDGLFWCSNTTINKLERLGDYAKARIDPNEKPTQISPRTMRNLRRVKKMTKMTERVAKGVLAGVVTATGLASGSVMRSKAGKKFFRMLPAEVALVSLDVFGKVFDAVELAGKSVLHSTRVVTSGVVAHRYNSDLNNRIVDSIPNDVWGETAGLVVVSRYGEQAGEAASEGLATVGHVLSTAWTVSKLRKVLNPNRAAGKVSKSALLKSAIRGKSPAA